MITQSTKRVACTEQEARQLPAWNFGTWAGGYLEFTVNASDSSDLRMVHNNTKVLGIIEGAPKSVTESIYTLFEGKDMADILEEIERLNLEPLPADQMPDFLDLDKDGKPDKLIAGSYEEGVMVTEDIDSVNILNEGHVTVLPKL